MTVPSMLIFRFKIWTLVALKLKDFFLVIKIGRLGVNTMLFFHMLAEDVVVTGDKSAHLAS